MKNMIVTVFILLFAVSATYAQDSISRKGFTANVEYRYFAGKICHHFDDAKFDWNSNSYNKSLRIYAGYFFTPKINLNIGTRIDAETTAWHLILQPKYYLTEKKNSFFVAGEGSFLKKRNDYDGAPYNGFDLSLFIGKELSISKYFAFNFHAGYSYNRSIPRGNAMAYGNDLISHNLRNNSEHALLLGVAFMLK
jgi:hypothetical protein